MTNLNVLAGRAMANSIEKGFEPARWSHPTLVMSKLMLVTTEIAEAAEAVRHEDFANFCEELADVVIRILDLAGPLEIDLAGAIEEKMAFNETRPPKHGKAL